MIPYDLHILLLVVQRLKLSELRSACEKAGVSVDTVLNMLNTYEVEINEVDGE